MIWPLLIRLLYFQLINPSSKRNPGNHAVKIPWSNVTQPVKRSISFFIARSRKNINQRIPHAYQSSANQIPNVVVAPWWIIIPVGIAETATNRQNHPKPLPSAPFTLFHATHKYVNANRRSCAASLKSPAVPSKRSKRTTTRPVSYTHLTLPTKA